MIGELRLVTRSADDTLAFAGGVAGLLRAGDVVVLAGDLGTGKTTFARGVARALGIDEPVTSPSFTIVREYEGRLPLVHVDVYRLGRLQELHDLGFDEIIGGEAVVLVEWGDAVVSLLPRDRLEVRLEAPGADDERLVSVTALGPAWAPRLDALAAVVGG